MKYKLEFCPNPDVVIFHFQKRLNSRIARFESPEEKHRIWVGDQMTYKDPPVYVKRLWEVLGLISISVHDYSIHLEKARAFEWNDMLERIVVILNLELFPDSEPEQLGESIRPSEEVLKSLREQGCEV